MLKHADKYSQAFNKDTYKLIQSGKVDSKELWKYSSFWYKGFDDMAFKTMLRQLLSKWGILSTEMQEAFDNDMAVINEDGSKTYVDNDNENYEVSKQSDIIEEPKEEQKSLNDI